jgi:hypothetical protein
VSRCHSRYQQAHQGFVVCETIEFELVGFAFWFSLG